MKYGAVERYFDDREPYKMSTHRKVFKKPDPNAYPDR